MYTTDQINTMGFSVSGATALLLVAFFIAFGAFYSATTGAFDHVQEAQEERHDQYVDTKNTDLSADSFYDIESRTLAINATNERATLLNIDDMDILVDGEYIVGWQENSNIDGDDNATLLSPHQTLNVEIAQDVRPSEIQVVTEYGVMSTSFLGSPFVNLELSIADTTPNAQTTHNWTFDDADYGPGIDGDDSEVDTITANYTGTGASFDGLTDANITVAWEREGDDSPTKINVNSDSYSGEVATFDLSGVTNTDIDGPGFIRIEDIDNPDAGDHEVTLIFRGDDTILGIAELTL
jgi:flagellar protein FlaF